MSTKYDFIKELLENKETTPNQKERILELAALEIGIDGTIEERVKKIEKIVFNDKPQLKSETILLFEEEDRNNEKQQKEVKNELPKSIPYKFPGRLYEFLFEYNQNRILRSTCHEIDSDAIDVINEYCNTEQYDFIKHRQKILDAYEIHEKKYYAPHQIKALIRAYITGKDYKGSKLTNGWSTDNIKIHWFHQDLLSWTIENSNLPPNLNETFLGDLEILGFEFEQINSKILDNTIRNFTELVLHFKHLFHIRHDNSLNEILKWKNDIENWNEIIKFEMTDTNFPRNLEMFTDIDKLVQAYKKVIELIIKQHKDDSKPIVNLSFTESDSSVFLSIHHLNNSYNKTITNTIDRGIGQDYNALIEKQLNGLGNLYLKANFGNDECAEINLWNGEEMKAKKIDHFEGVEHIIELPKKINNHVISY